MQAFAGIKDKETGKIVYVYNPDPRGGSNFLGKGQFGEVFKGMEYDQDTGKTGGSVAIKKIDLVNPDEMGDEEAEDLRKSINAEIDIFKKINDKRELYDNEYLVKVLGIYQTPRHVYVIMEYCPGGNLQELMIKRANAGMRFNEMESLYIIHNLIQGLIGLL